MGCMVTKAGKCRMTTLMAHKLTLDLILYHWQYYGWAYNGNIVMPQLILMFVLLSKSVVFL